MSAKQSPSRQLPPNPSFEQLKNQDRDLLKAHKGGTPEAGLDDCLRVTLDGPEIMRGFCAALEKVVGQARS